MQQLLRLGVLGSVFCLGLFGVCCLVVEVVAIRCIATGVGVFCVAKGGFAGKQGVKVLSKSFSQY